MLMTLDVCVGRWRRNDGGRGNIKIMWWNLIGGKSKFCLEIEWLNKNDR